MPKVISVGEYIPPNEISQNLTSEFAKEIFSDSFHDINRLLKVFNNGQVEKRHFSEGLEWFKKEHSFEEKNNLYIEKAVEYGVKAIENCLSNPKLLKNQIPYEEIDLFVFISSTGISTPSIDARIMNRLPMSHKTKRIPIWGLGCAGGAAGLARAFDYCKAYPKAKVIVLSIELCSLTFQKNDLTKSNLIGTSLFADGVACACVVGDTVDCSQFVKMNAAYPFILGSQSTLMENSEDVMGWDIKNDGLYVVFSKDIPSIIRTWLSDNVQEFLQKHNLSIRVIDHFIAHPGGKKVLDAYEESLCLSKDKMEIPLYVLKNYGNMSSATILYVLKRFMESNRIKAGEYGLGAALGPGFSSELLLLQWR